MRLTNILNIMKDYNTDLDDAKHDEFNELQYEQYDAASTTAGCITATIRIEACGSELTEEFKSMQDLRDYMHSNSCWAQLVGFTSNGETYETLADYPDESSSKLEAQGGDTSNPCNNKEELSDNLVTTKSNQTKSNTMKPIAAIVTNTKTAISNMTGEDVVIHDIYTIDGEFVQVWSDTPAPLAKVNEETYVVCKVDSYKKHGEPVERKHWHIIPTAFAEKMISSAV
tara:strand:- start:2991 stop:3671 length:681 start_codon:yes stop_codon:yes gene_type:complete